MIFFFRDSYSECTISLALGGLFKAAPECESLMESGYGEVLSCSFDTSEKRNGRRKNSSANDGDVEDDLMH